MTELRFYGVAITYDCGMREAKCEANPQPDLHIVTSKGSVPDASGKARCVENYVTYVHTRIYNVAQALAMHYATDYTTDYTIDTAVRILSVVYAAFELYS